MTESETAYERKILKKGLSIIMMLTAGIFIILISKIFLTSTINGVGFVEWLCSPISSLRIWHLAILALFLQTMAFFLAIVLILSLFLYVKKKKFEKLN